MSKNLIIVESPAKAKTLKKYLGKDFEVLASYGHVRDLLPKVGAVDPDNDFAMTYQIIEKNSKHVDQIIKSLKKVDALYLATDPDREGEAISWHVYELLKKKRALKDKKIYRVVFHEITKRAVNDAVANPRELSMDLVNAQQARRALDYLVGFNLSPLLWKKIRRGLSAGRVQSPALRMIVEREEEIEKFIAQEYWTIEADLTADNQEFIAKLSHYQNEKLSQFSITNTEQASDIKAVLEKHAQGKLIVSNIEKKSRKRNPQAPFITSTLQQDAVRKFGFTAKRVMMIAQQLYEGIDFGNGPTGLITYMRTDSVNLAVEAVESIRHYVAEKYGADFLPETPHQYRTKTKNAQEAHEAIRPTDINVQPDSIKDKLSEEQFKIYDLIWKRALACQMIHATVHTVAIDLGCGAGNTFRAAGSTIAKPGYLIVYQDERSEGARIGSDPVLPAMQVGDAIPLKQIRNEQHFTEPPPRYNEATLVKALEDYGIGRPSTYASIISTLQDRKYVILENKRFIPTDVGRVVNRFLTEYFQQYVDYDFTARLEDQLDEISRGEKQWVPLLKDFWHPFKGRVDDITENVKRQDVTQEALDEECPKCGKMLTIRLGRRGKFIGCSGYPECTYTRDHGSGKDEQAAAEVLEDRKCPECEHPLVIKFGRYGKFIGCSNYPNCKYIEPLQKPTPTGVVCPQCKQGEIQQRRSRRGKIFYSCNRYPDCQYAIWNEPTAEACPKCQWPILMIKITKRRGKEKVCPQKECGFSEQVPEEEEVK